MSLSQTSMQLLYKAVRVVFQYLQYTLDCVGFKEPMPTYANLVFCIYYLQGYYSPCDGGEIQCHLVN